MSTKQRKHSLKLQAPAVTYKIKAVKKIPDATELVWGQIQTRPKTIYVDKTLDDENYYSTLLHEAYHGYLYDLGYTSSEAQEQLAVQTETFIRYTIRNNRWLLLKLLEAIK